MCWIACKQLGVQLLTQPCHAAAGGTIALDSAPGRGARFTVVVPVQLLPDDADEGSCADVPICTSLDVCDEAAAATGIQASLSGTAAAAVEEAANSPVTPVAADAGTRLRVLLVDDHQASRARRSACLSHAACTQLTAARPLRSSTCACASACWCVLRAAAHFALRRALTPQHGRRGLLRAAGAHGCHHRG